MCFFRLCHYGNTNTEKLVSKTRRHVRSQSITNEIPTLTFIGVHTEVLLLQSIPCCAKQCQNYHSQFLQDVLALLSKKWRQNKKLYTGDNHPSWLCSYSSYYNRQHRISHHLSRSQTGAQCWLCDTKEQAILPLEPLLLLTRDRR